MVALARNGIPIDVQNTWSDARLMAAYVLTIEHESQGRLRWDNTVGRFEERQN